MTYALWALLGVALACAFLHRVSRPHHLAWVRTRDGRTSNNVHDARS